MKPRFEQDNRVGKKNPFFLKRCNTFFRGEITGRCRLKARPFHSRRSFLSPFSRYSPLSRRLLGRTHPFARRNLLITSPRPFRSTSLRSAPLLNQRTSAPVPSLLRPLYLAYGEGRRFTHTRTTKKRSGTGGRPTSYRRASRKPTLPPSPPNSRF